MMKKEKKQKELSPKIKRQLDILSKYYDINFETRTITLELAYDKVGDMFEDNIVSTKIIKFKNEILQKVSAIMDTFPVEFQIDLQFKISDYEGYEPQRIVDAFKDSLEMFHYAIHREKSSRLLEAVILCLVSVGILFIRQFCLQNNVINDNMLITEMLDIVAWVFLWQSVTVLFLTPNEYREISFKILTRLDHVTLYEKEKVVLKISQEEIQHNWVQITKAERLSKRIMIISGAFTFATGIMSLVNGITSYLSSPFSVSSLLAFLFSLIISGVVSILGGLGAISVYRDKGPFQKLVPFCAIFYLIADALLILFIIMLVVAEGSLSLGVGIIGSFATFFISSILYFVSYLVLRHVNKLNRIKNAQ